MSMRLIEPRVSPPLDKGFRPAVLANHGFQRDVQPVGIQAVIGLERSESDFSRFLITVYPEDHPEFEANYQYVERVVKFLLWQCGGHVVYFGGPRRIAEYLRQTYSENGARVNLIITLWGNRFTKRNSRLPLVA